MRQTLLVTGATGLLGANVCRLAVGQGRKVRALVRRPEDAAAVQRLGAEPCVGDISDVRQLEKVMKGIQGVVHAAALVGGTWSQSTPEEFEQANYRGVLDVLEAAMRAEVERTLLVTSVAIYDATTTLTERSPILPISATDSPYTQSKRASYYEAMHRACRGQNLAFLVPAAIYGPSPNVERALAPTSFNSALLRGITGELTEFADFPMNWVFAEDAARVTLAAIDQDQVGRCYVAAGRADDECALAVFCNAGAEKAGSPHRVLNKPLGAITSNLGTMAAMAKRVFAKPFVDSRVTQESCGVPATSLDVGLERTLQWLREHKKIS